MNNGLSTKHSSKGTPKFIRNSRDEYLNALFHGQIPNCSFNSIRGDKRFCSNVTREITKKTMNAIYLKGRVAENLIDITPYTNK